MILTLESTTEIVDIENGGGLQARVWEGTTAAGVKVQALIVRIAVHKESDCSQFERELQEKRTPSAGPRAFPARMIL